VVTPSDLAAAREAFHAGNDAYGRGDLAGAAAAFTAALELAPERVSAMVNLAMVHADQGAWTEAHTLLTRALALEPEHADAWHHLGHAETGLGHPAEACAAWQKALTIDPSRVATRYCLGRAERARGNAPAAFEHFKALVAALPERADFCFEAGLALLDTGAAQSAEKYFIQAVQHDDTHTAAWVQLGALRKDRGATAAAIEAFHRALALDPQHTIAPYLLAAIDATAPTPPIAPRTYVAHLFDAYSHSFDHHLEALDYRAPELLASLLDSVAPSDQRWDPVLDLGCGTGKTAAAIQGRTGAVDGIDLSGRMCTMARDSGLYRDVHEGDIVDFVANTQYRYDMVIATDTFIYLGALDNLFVALQRILRPNGLLAFSVEHCDGDSYVLRKSSRYAHSTAYILECARRSAFAVIGQQSGPIRNDQSVPIPGEYWVLRRPR
jgi:predicted TPR repeat methyltransferase